MLICAFNFEHKLPLLNSVRAQGRARNEEQYKVLSGYFCSFQYPNQLHVEFHFANGSMYHVAL